MKQTARFMDDAGMRPEALSPAREVPLALMHMNLMNFRSYARAELVLDRTPVVLAGANGTGKTNLLEAVSLLSPGRGLRSAKMPLLQRKAPTDTAVGPDDAFTDALWAVSATVSRPTGLWEMGTGGMQTPGRTPRRTMHLNGVPAPASDLAELIPMLWLTPAMDRLFLEGPGERRRFLDRLTFALDPAHAKHAVRYERAMQERMHLLRDGVRDPSWLDGLEDTIAEEGVALTQARISAIDVLNSELSMRRAQGTFPTAQLSLNDASGDYDAGRLQSALASSRERDASAGRCSIGPHLGDLDVRHTSKRADARDCSTGEQKALLISIVLANAWLNKKRHDGIAPLLLLDEIAAHLDVQRRAALFEEILALESQAWLTGTDKNLFSPLQTSAQFFSITAGQFVRQD